MSTMQFHKMKTLPTERTKIKIITSTISAFCYRCHKMIYPNVIVSGFLETPLSVCPDCKTVVQENKPCLK